MNKLPSTQEEMDDYLLSLETPWFWMRKLPWKEIPATTMTTATAPTPRPAPATKPAPVAKPKPVTGHVSRIGVELSKAADEAARVQAPKPAPKPDEPLLPDWIFIP